jgi:hypothetical protein
VPGVGGAGRCNRDKFNGDEAVLRQSPRRPTGPPLGRPEDQLRPVPVAGLDPGLRVGMVMKNNEFLRISVRFPIGEEES